MSFLDTELPTHSRPANAPSLFAKFGRQLLVGPQDTLRPNQRFHLLQFWPRVNETCCWPLVSCGKFMLCPLCCILGSQISAIKAFGDKLTSCKRGHRGSFDRYDIAHACIQILGLDLERNCWGKPVSPRSPAHCFAESQLSRGFVCFCEPRLRQRETNLRTFNLQILWLVSFVSLACFCNVVQLNSYLLGEGAG